MDIDGTNAAWRCWAVAAMPAFLWACAAPAGPDLETFLQRRAICDHLRGEIPDPPDARRMREIEQQTNEYCTGTDAQLAQLKTRYRDDAAVSRQLAAFEPQVEQTAK
jgi:hypothetical protein